MESLNNPVVQDLVLPHLDLPSALALACTSRYFSHICAHYHALRLPQSEPSQLHVLPSAAAFPVAPVATAMSSPSSAAASPSRTEADFDGMSGSETDVTSPEEDEWEFKVTPDMMRRLSMLPKSNPSATLSTIPTELQLEIFSHLDKIDSVCLGLTCSRAYNIYRTIYGTKMPLNTRRIGPNSLESAWEVIGKQECKQCGMFRCELWQHIKTWMPGELEYCSMKQNFGSPAKPGAAESCYRGKPSKPRRCGRHPIRTTTIHQDDNGGLQKLFGR
ncbi:hypothetical protein OIDMADRAFT_176628 [Oidiodendron maius Zn]|uniref:F-box domain-containing protein n=1 Tax=Oidiodendron maius (strain Zn) TaxID=913774 RepID=A0A0C3HED1_OIDMZ|nr:hypothetical protein OIDMADRAFT_176628 [Oidiodendron maius Zn]